MVRVVANHSPLNTITLSDADAETALAFVQQKLREVKLDIKFTPQATASIDRLGGRAGDLDNVSLLCLLNYALYSILTPTPLVDLQGSQRFEY